MGELLTIGYEGATLVHFLATLRSAGVEVLADVRAVPISRKPGFSKKALDANLAEIGITYLHFVELGDPKPGRDAARAGRIVEFRQIYGDHILSSGAQSSLKKLADVAESKRTCLLCFERLPETCHRRIVAEHLVHRGFAVVDLFVGSPSRHVNRSSDLHGHDPRQSLAAAE
ncbi:hypothetical protein C2U72_22400 [Prosthecomicrobium hirschii]|nr:hypothetical protein C2U72_22400 [Prosthecomicrobium hirschii]